MKIGLMRAAARSGKMRCPICENPRLLIEHHIHGRDIPGKNKLWNRCWICASCHDDVHSGKIIIEGWILTSEGKKLVWRRIGEEPTANEGAKPNLYGKDPQEVPYPERLSAMSLVKGDMKMSYEVKNVKGFRGHDCLGFNATLYRDGLKIADVTNDGGGGMMDFHWFDYSGPRVEVLWTDHEGKPWTIKGCTVEEAKLYEAIRGKTWKMDPELGGADVQMSMDMFVSGLVDDFENAKRFRRLCKDKTLFRVKGDPTDSWRTFKAPYSKRIKDIIVAKYGDTVEVIMNETLGQVAA